MSELAMAGFEATLTIAALSMLAESGATGDRSERALDIRTSIAAAGPSLHKPPCAVANLPRARPLLLRTRPSGARLRVVPLSGTQS